MPSISIKAFRGMVPRRSQRLLQGNQATAAFNCKITSGRLDPLNGLLAAAAVATPNPKAFYRYRHFVGGLPTYLWLTFAEPTDMVVSPLANDPQGRIFYTSSAHEPRMATYAQVSSSSPYPGQWYALGVPNPTTAPTVGVTGGTAPTEVRSYAYTFVTALGEESGPSPASAPFTGNINGTWNLTAMQTAPPNSGTITAAVANTPTTGTVRVTFDTTFGLAVGDVVTVAAVVGLTDLNGARRVVAINGNNVDFLVTTSQTYTSGGTWTRAAAVNTSGMVKRIYRTAGTESRFLYVAEIAAATTSYNDTIAASALGEEIQTTDNVPPPKNLTSLISLPNGCLAGISGTNELCLSDPYLPYSWPLRNRYSFSGAGVALAPTANSVIVLTDSYPILFTGSSPEAMSPSTLGAYAPCAAKSGVVQISGGCLNPSYDGLWVVTPARVENITSGLYTEDEWGLLNPSTFVAEFHDGRYYANHSTTGDPRVLMLNLAEPDSVVEVDETFSAIRRNDFDGKLYVSKDTDVLEWDSNPGKAYASDWVSATFQLARPTNFAVAQVHAEYADIVPVDTSITDANAALIAAGPDAVAGHLNGIELLETEINGSLLVPNSPDTVKKVQFTLYADGVPVHSQLVTSPAPFRLPAGYRAEVFNIGLNASVATYSVAVASSISELKTADV